MSAAPLPVDKAIPCGLIVNELVTNAFKHAFIGRRQDACVIRVSWEHAGTRRRLTVADNGVGMPSDVCLESPRKLGLRLVHMLARQLRGSVACECAAGCRITLEFPAP